MKAMLRPATGQEHKS